MKVLLILFILLEWTDIAVAQADSIFKYTYTFRPDNPTGKAGVVIDSSINKSGKTTIAIKITINQYSQPSTISLKSNNINLWNVFVLSGTFDTVINPGDYVLAVNEVSYLQQEVKFSARGEKNLYFKFHMQPYPSLRVYQINSKIELSKKKIDKIKTCVEEKNDLRACTEKNIYYLSIQI